MFLSVIISCHNCRDYIQKVMNSLVIQNFDDMEVIISDDCSDDNFMEVVEKYKGLLDIKYFKTNKHKYHCPGNTRRDGLSHATGEWVTFMDHDDTFKENAFNTVRYYLNENKDQYDDIQLVFTPVQKVDMNGNPIKVIDAVTWLHGNFYKRSFLEKHDINFKEDLFGNEDLYFNNRVQAEIAGNNYRILNISSPLYNWYSNPKSLSNTRQGDDVLGYTEKYFGDYLYANSIPHIEGYKKYTNLHDKFRREMLQAMMYSYIYYERALYQYKDENLLKEMLYEIKKTYDLICDTLGIGCGYVVSYMTEDVKRFNDARSLISELSGAYIETHGVGEFFEMLSK